MTARSTALKTSAQNQPIPVRDLGNLVCAWVEPLWQKVPQRFSSPCSTLHRLIAWHS